MVSDRYIRPLAQVITPSAGGPAERAGIEPKDVLLAIGDRPMENISLFEAGDLLQGTEGTEVPATCPSIASPENVVQPSFSIGTLLPGPGPDFLGRKDNPYMGFCSRLHPGGSDSLQMPTGGAEAEAA